MKLSYKVKVIVLILALLVSAILGVVIATPQIYVPTQHFYGQVVEINGNQAWVDLDYLEGHYSPDAPIGWHPCRQDFPLLNSHLANGSFVYFDANQNWIDYHFYTIRGINASATQLAYELGSSCMQP